MSDVQGAAAAQPLTAGLLESLQSANGRISNCAEQLRTLNAYLGTQQPLQPRPESDAPERAGILGAIADTLENAHTLLADLEHEVLCLQKLA
jgi:hypothetical protein